MDILVFLYASYIYCRYKVYANKFWDMDVLSANKAAYIYILDTQNSYDI